MIREAVPADADALASLIAQLDFSVVAGDVVDRLAHFADIGQPVLVAAHDEGEVIGCLSWNIMPVLHRDTAVGRISMLVVDERFRSRGIGALLVAEAERRMIARGCRLIEVTSNEKRMDAHRFYQRLGYERTSLRFGKKIGG